tara:strand:+ start:1249 stop:2094 length:846 start_codon:yes stop_codon:yes gene_type:complete
MLTGTSWYILWVGFCFAAAGILVNLFIKDLYKKKDNHQLFSKNNLVLQLYMIIVSLFLVLFVLNLLGVALVLILERGVSEGFFIPAGEWDLSISESIVSISCCVILVAIYSLCVRDVFAISSRISQVKSSFYQNQSANRTGIDLEAADQNSRESTESTGPVTLDDIISALEFQLKHARQDAENAKSELQETRKKVASLEVEIGQKEIEINKILASKSNLDRVLEEQDIGGDSAGRKSLSIQDSVVVGDTIFGGIKIDKLILNDAQAIAEAIIQHDWDKKSD